MLLRNSAVLWRELDGEAILLDPQEGCSYNLNQVGTLIWTLLDGKHTLAGIATTLCEAFEVEHAQALQDVQQLVNELLEHKLLSEVVFPSPTSA